MCMYVSVCLSVYVYNSLLLCTLVSVFIRVFVGICMSMFVWVFVFVLPVIISQGRANRSSYYACAIHIYYVTVVIDSSSRECPQRWVSFLY